MKLINYVMKHKKEKFSFLIDTLRVENLLGKSKSRRVKISRTRLDSLNKRFKHPLHGVKEAFDLQVFVKKYFNLQTN